MNFNVGVVIPCGENRIENVVECVKHLKKQTIKPYVVAIVCDGFDGDTVIKALTSKNLWNNNNFAIASLSAPKHVAGSGTLQPKNYGAAWIDRRFGGEVNNLWFLDSDIIVEKFALEAYKKAYSINQNRILIGPYEWLPSGIRKIKPELHNDPRTQMFQDYDTNYTSVGEIHFALANFGGNIIYPLKDFKAVGGFWDDLSAGRVEDGEMGLRCASMGIPMAVVPNARGYHLDHPVNHQWKLDTNEKEVPMINKRHPWIQNEGIIMVEKDGKRFDWINSKTGESINTNEIWNYKKEKVIYE